MKAFGLFFAFGGASPLNFACFFPFCIGWALMWLAICDLAGKPMDKVPWLWCAAGGIIGAVLL